MQSWWLPLVGVFLVLTCNVGISFGKSYVVSSESPVDASSEKSDGTTANPGEPPKIYQMAVETNVSNRYSKTLITSKVRNLNSHSEEATFSVVTPDKAFISGFVMEIDGKKYEAYVQEKEEAKQTYNAAVARGQAAGHVAVSARDSNRFTVSVNVEPQSKAIFYLTYEELLERKDEQYEVVLNIHPGQPVKDLSVKVNVVESRPLKFVKTPALRSGNEVSKNYPKVDPEAEIKKINETASVVTFNPDIARQKVFASTLGGKEEEGLSGQFVVQYDVERDPQGGEILVDGGHFVHFFAPADLPPLKKQVVFILDTSGSMYGTRITQLKEAMDSILAELKSEDIFSIVDFNSRVHVWNIPEKAVTYSQGDDPFLYSDVRTKSSDKLAKEVLPVSIPASTTNVENAKQIVKEFIANGGTDIQTALEIGLRIVASNPDPKSHQPIIIFLTDGEPTVGETHADQITKKVTELNTRKVPIFSLSFGDGADREFLRKLSLKNQGFGRHIYEAGDSYLQLENFYKQISSPLLSNVTFKYTDKITSLSKHHFPILFHGGELYITGKLGESEDWLGVDTGSSLPPVQAWGINGPIELKPKVYRAAGSLERLWAYLTVKQLLEQREVAEDKKGPTQEALRLALQYSFVTDVSSLVVVKPNATSAVNTEDAAKVPEFTEYEAAVPLNVDLNRITGISWSARGRNILMLHRPAFRASVFPSALSTSYGGIRTFAGSSLSTPMYTRYIGKPHFGSGPIVGSPSFVASTTQQTSLKQDPFPQIPWIKDTLNENGTLTLDSVVYSLGVGETVALEPECPNSLNNSTGHCTLLGQCPQIYPQLTDLSTYRKYFCALEQSTYAGVCCPLLPAP